MNSLSVLDTPILKLVTNTLINVVDLYFPLLALLLALSHKWSELGEFTAYSFVDGTQPTRARAPLGSLYFGAGVRGLAHPLLAMHDNRSPAPVPETAFSSASARDNECCRGCCLSSYEA